MEGDEVLYVLCRPADSAGGQRGKVIRPNFFDFFLLVDLREIFFRSRFEGTKKNK